LALLPDWEGEITLIAPYTDDKTLIRTFTIYTH
jgi:hypothetical protein